MKEDPEADYWPPPSGFQERGPGNLAFLRPLLRCHLLLATGRPGDGPRDPSCCRSMMDGLPPCNSEEPRGACPGAPLRSSPTGYRSLAPEPQLRLVRVSAYPSVPSATALPRRTPSPLGWCNPASPPLLGALPPAPPAASRSGISVQLSGDPASPLYGFGMAVSGYCSVTVA